MAWFAAGLMLPVLAAYTLVARCDREARNAAATFFLRACLAIGVGVGLSSCTYFLWLFFVGPPGKTYRVCELAVFAAAGLWGFVLILKSHLRPNRPRLCKPPNPAEDGWATHGHKFLLMAFVAALALAMLGAVGAYWKDPLGDWDAWAIWNQRARFLFRSGDQWRLAFSPVFSHTDYPLLVPGSNARLWSYLGAERSWTPWFLGSLLTFATVGALAAGVSRLRSGSQGLLAGMALLGMVPFLQRGTLQYADVPLAFFILAAVLLLVLYDASQQPCREMLVLSGLMAGLAAWTKNEGLLLLIVLPAARCAAAWRRDFVVKELLCWSAGALPVLAVVALQKACLAGSNDLVGGQGWEASLARLLDPARYWCVFQAFILYTLRIARPFAVVLPLCFLLLGATKDRADGARGLRMACAVLMLMLAGYFLVYVTTPCDLNWHLASSAERLLLHLWPLCLLVLFLHLATPEELLAGESDA